VIFREGLALARRRLRPAIPWGPSLAVLALVAGAAAESPSTPSEIAPENASASEPTLEAFLEGMAATPGVVACFREVKEIGMLSVPLEVRGTLWFEPPDRLARVTTEPSRTRLVIDGQRFVFHDEAGSERFDLSANPLAREFAENFVVLFGGDPQALRARYEPTLQIEEREWRLVLRPRHRPLADVVERVTLEGKERRLTRMELLETDGDRTTTHFLEVETDRRFDEEERAHIFGSQGLPPARDGADGDAPEAR